MSLDDIPEIVVICTQYNGMGLLWWVGGGIGHIKMHAEECEELFVLLLSRNSLQLIPKPLYSQPKQGETALPHRKAARCYADACDGNCQRTRPRPKTL